MTEETVPLYPRSDRNKEQKERKEQIRLERYKARRYRVDYEINRGRGTNRSTSYYRTELGARIDAFFMTLGATSNPFTKVKLTRRY